MSSRLVVNSVRHTGASADAITLDSSGNVTFPANATCSGTATGFGGGKLLQVVQDTKTDGASSSSTGSDVAISGLSATITPSASTSKVLVLVTMTHAFDNASAFVYRLLRGSTALNVGSVDPGGSLTGYVGTVAGRVFGNANMSQPVSITFLDTPNTTSATTYSLTIKHEAGTWYLNSGNGIIGAASSIQAIEIGA